MTNRTAARRYARALFDVALVERHDLDQIDEQVSGFAGLMSSNEPLQRVLLNPAIPASRKRAVVEQLVARSPLLPVVSRLLLLLAERDRLVLVPDLVDAYRSRLMDHRHVVRAEVTTALPLPDDRVAALRQALARATGRDVQLNVQVDPEIVGGAVARLGSTVYDGSVLTQLEKMRRRLVDAPL